MRGSAITGTIEPLMADNSLSPGTPYQSFSEWRVIHSEQEPDAQINEMPPALVLVRL
jgi:hypothetical protein